MKKQILEREKNQTRGLGGGFREKEGEITREGDSERDRERERR